MTINSTDIRLQLSLGPDYSDEEIGKYTDRLYDTLRETDADKIEQVREGELPDGAKGDPITIGAILLGVGIAVAPTLIGVISNWLTRQHIDTVSITLTLENGMSLTIPAGLSDKEIKDKGGLLSNELKRIRD